MGAGTQAAEQLGDRLGYRFRDLDRLNRALTHASARADAGSDYERLEFLGDRVLGLLIAEMLFQLYPDAKEGDLSVKLNALVNGNTLAEIGSDIGLSDYIRTGSDIKSVRGRKGANLRADVMEALIATVYIEGGLEAARPVIEKHWKRRAELLAGARRDAKTELQEWAHQVAGTLPDYVVRERSGPDHDPTFTVEVSIAGKKPQSASGRSKREAEQAAATLMLEREGVWTPMQVNDD